MKPCRHLDHSGDYPGCTLRTAAPQFPDVLYWERGDALCEGGKLPRNVQFCGKGRGRTNAIFDCYEAPGPANCYQPEDEVPS